MRLTAVSPSSNTTATSSIATQKPKKKVFLLPLLFLLLLLPTSVLLLHLLRLTCNGFLFFSTERIPYIQRNDNIQQDSFDSFSTNRRRPVRESKLSLSSLQLLVGRRKSIPIKDYVPVLVPYERSKNISSSTSKSEETLLKGRTKTFLESLQHSSQQPRKFSTRAEEFFRGYPPKTSCCKTRFFMTWISSLETFGQREMFAMESLFRFHPDACLLVLSNTMDSSNGTKLLRPFTEKGYRVSAISPDYTHLFKRTPAERWFDQLKKGVINPGVISLGQNLSNLLRLAVLYKFGGVYLDTDVIILKNFSNLKNVIGVQTVDPITRNWTILNNAVMVFDEEHPLVYKFMEEFSLTFDGNRWGHNGPYLVSRVVRRLEGKPGYNFTILPPQAFYPFGWNRIDGLFRGPHGTALHSKWITEKVSSIRNESFAVHLWNRVSRKLKIEKGSVIGQIMLDNCLFSFGLEKGKNGAQVQRTTLRLLT